MKILVGIGVVFLLVVILALALPFLVDLNAYQEQYRPVIEEALNRQIILQDIRLTVWPRIGARVAGFAVMDDPAFGADPFTSLTSLDVGVKLMPLVSGRIEIEDITLVDPVITVIKNTNGVLNVSTLGRKGIAAPKTPSRAPLPSPEGPLKILAMLAVDRVSIIGGTLTYRDLSAGKPREYVLKDLEFLLKSVRLDEIPSLHLATLVQPFGMPVTLEGTFGPLKETADLEVINLKLTMGKTSFAIVGSVAGRNATLNISAPAINTADLPVALPLKKPVDVTDLQIAAEVKDQDTELRNLSFQMFAGQVTAQGGMTSGSDRPPFKGHVTIQGLQLGPVLEAIGTGRVSVSGTASADLALRGRGFAMPDLIRALEGPGHITVKEGRIEGVNLIDEVSSLFKVVGVSPGALKFTAFSTVETMFGIKQGIVNVQRLVMDSHDFQAAGTGVVGFDQTLKLKMNLHLSEALSRKIADGSPAVRLASNDGRLGVPVVITGTAQAPSYSLDTKALGAKAQAQAKQQVTEAVGDLLKGSSRPKDVEQKGQELLKGLGR